MIAFKSFDTAAFERNALAAAGRDAMPGDRVLAFGSFFVAAAALGFAQSRGEGTPLAPIQLGGRV